MHYDLGPLLVMPICDGFGTFPFGDRPIIVRNEISACLILLWAKYQCRLRQQGHRVEVAEELGIYCQSGHNRKGRAAFEFTFSALEGLAVERP